MIQWYTNNNAVTRPGASECLEMPLVFPLARIFANPNHSLASLSVTMPDLLSLTLRIGFGRFRSKTHADGTVIWHSAVRCHTEHSLAVLRKSVTRFIHNNIAKSLAVLTGGELKGIRSVDDLTVQIGFGFQAECFDSRGQSCRFHAKQFCGTSWAGNLAVGLGQSSNDAFTLTSL